MLVEDTAVIMARRFLLSWEGGKYADKFSITEIPFIQSVFNGTPAVYRSLCQTQQMARRLERKSLR